MNELISIVISIVSWLVGYMFLGLILMGLEVRFGIPFTFIISINRGSNEPEKFKERFKQSREQMWKDRKFVQDLSIFSLFWIVFAFVSLVVIICELIGLLGKLARFAWILFLRFLHFFHNGFRWNPPVEPPKE